jgi:hypothetical protein
VLDLGCGTAGVTGLASGANSTTNDGAPLPALSYATDVVRPVARQAGDWSEHRENGALDGQGGESRRT